MQLLKTNRWLKLNTKKLDIKKKNRITEQPKNLKNNKRSILYK